MLGVYFYTINKKKEEYKYLRWGLTLKIIGGISFGLIYMFYYGYGDTFAYFESAQILKQILVDEPIYGLKLIFNLQDYVRAEDYLYNHFLINYYRGADTFTVIKVAGLLSVFGAGGYYTTTILFSCFAFYGQWKLYQTFIVRYPSLKFELAIAHFLIPSVIFWGAGIMKDSLVIGFFGLFIYHISRLKKDKGFNITSIIMSLISIYFIYLIKGYVLLALFPALLFWIFFTINENIRSRVLKTIILPVLLISVSLSSIYGYFVFSSVDDRYSQEKMISQVVVLQSNHFSEDEQEGTRSGYTLGEFDQSIGGMLQKIVPAIGTTLYRPFPWEIKNVVMALASLESFLYTLATLFMLYRVKFKNIYKILLSDAFLVMALVFTILFAFIVGFSSYNFGALVRYKIPCLPLFSSLITILIYSETRLNISRWSMRASN